MNKEGLYLDSICKRFAIRQQSASIGTNPGIEKITLTIAAGEGFSLLGPSGCGKTTTLRIIGGFETPDSGRVYHHSKDITDDDPQDRNIRTVFQKYALFPHLNVRDNIVFGLRMQKVKEQEIQKRAKSIAELIEIPHLLQRNIQQLSGGEQQRVALARALITEPEVLLLDEPLSALDLKLRERMQLELLALRHKLGSSFIFVTHDQTEAMTLSDRIAVMNKGQIEQIGSPEEIYSRPKTKFVASFIGQANFFGSSQAHLLKGDTNKLPTLGSNTEWMTRPEHITPRKLGHTLAAGFVALEARVQEVAFLGADRLTKAVDATGKQYLAKTPGFEPPIGEINENILLTWETEDTWTINAEAKF